MFTAISKNGVLNDFVYARHDVPSGSDSVILSWLRVVRRNPPDGGLGVCEGSEVADPASACGRLEGVDDGRALRVVLIHMHVNPEELPRPALLPGYCVASGSLFRTRAVREDD